MPRGHPYVPTDENRRVVEVMAGCGDSNDDICKAVGVCRDVLYRHYQDELENGRARCHAQVKAKLFELCMEKHPASIFFFLKTQCGFRETSNLNVTDDRLVPALIELLPKFLGAPQAEALVNELEQKLKS
jgi:hypothetical protein